VKPGGCVVLKAGADAHKAAIIEIRWPNSSSKATTSWTIRTTADIPKPDPAVAHTVEKIMSKVKALEFVQLHENILPENVAPNMAALGLGQDRVLSSQRVRFQPTTMGVFLANICKIITVSDVCIIEAGNIKGETNYTGQTFNMAALRNEFPLECEMVYQKWTGGLIKDIIEWSRSHPDEEEKCFAQCDAGVWFDSSGKVTHLAGEPIDVEKIYLVSSAYASTVKFQSNPKLKKYYQDNPIVKGETYHAKEKLPRSEEDGKPAKVLIIDYLADLLWEKLTSFEQIDKSGDGVLSKKEVHDAYVKVFKPARGTDAERQALDHTIDLLMSDLDKDGNGISRDEYDVVFHDKTSKVKTFMATHPSPAATATKKS